MYSCMSSGGLELTFMICHIESRRTDFKGHWAVTGLCFLWSTTFVEACHLPQLTTKQGVCYIQCQHAFSTDA